MKFNVILQKRLTTYRQLMAANLPTHDHTAPRYSWCRKPFFLRCDEIFEPPPYYRFWYRRKRRILEAEIERLCNVCSVPSNGRHSREIAYRSPQTCLKPSNQNKRHLIHQETHPQWPGLFVSRFGYVHTILQGITQDFAIKAPIRRKGSLCKYIRTDSQES